VWTGTPDDYPYRSSLNSRSHVGVGEKTQRCFCGSLSLCRLPTVWSRPLHIIFYHAAPGPWVLPRHFSFLDMRDLGDVFLFVTPWLPHSLLGAEESLPIAWSVCLSLRCSSVTILAASQPHNVALTQFITSESPSNLCGDCSMGVLASAQNDTCALLFRVVKSARTYETAMRATPNDRNLWQPCHVCPSGGRVADGPFRVTVSDLSTGQICLVCTTSASRTSACVPSCWKCHCVTSHPASLPHAKVS
jgi:hypothetical protein